MAQYNPPTENLDIFNTNKFIDDDSSSLTLNQTDHRYLKLIGGSLSGDLTINDEKQTLRLTNTSTSVLAASSDCIDYNMCLHNNTSTSGKTTGLAFFNAASAYETTAPTCAIYGNRTGSDGRGDMMLATKESTSCIDRLKIQANGMIAVNSADAALQFEINNETGQCLRLKYNDSIDKHADFLLNSFGDLFIQPTQSTFINSSDPNVLTVKKTADDAVEPDDTCSRYLMSLNYAGADQTQQAGLCFSNAVDSSIVSPGAAINFIANGANSKGDLFFSTKGTTGITDNCDERLRINSQGLIGIGTNAPIYPLHVSKTTSVDIGDYIYLNSSGTIGSVAAGSANDYSIFASGRIVCTGELDVISDERIKTNIENLDLNYCKKFIDNVEPKSFNYKHELNKKSHGYIAQDIFKSGFVDLTSFVSSPGVQESTDSSGFRSPADYQFSISSAEIISILHTCIKDLYEKCAKLEQKLKQKNYELCS